MPIFTQPTSGFTCSSDENSLACRQLPTSSTHASLFLCPETFASTEEHVQGKLGHAEYLLPQVGNCQPVSLWISTPAWPSWQCGSISFMLPQRVAMKLSQLPIAIICLLIHPLSVSLKSLSQKKHKVRHPLSPFLLKFQWTWLRVSSSPEREGGSYL